MGRRGRKSALYAAAHGATQAREAIERRWYQRTAPTQDDQAKSFLSGAVTAQGSRDEPFHRWMSYTQGFSPQLVRAFIEELAGREDVADPHPVLDPFSGSGATVIACARAGVPAIGIDASPALTFLSKARWESDCPPLSDLGDDSSWHAFTDSLELPIHRAALMLAVARGHKSDGRPHKNAKPLAETLRRTISMMQEDLLTPLPRRNEVVCGDARDMSHLESESVGSILTSPPYLSRHDYTRITRPYAEVYEHWYPASQSKSKSSRRSMPNGRVDEVRSHPRAIVSDYTGVGGDRPEAISESCESLEASGDHKLARIVDAYFADMFRVICECQRVLRGGGTFWMVIGGARIQRTYVPSDLILAEFAESVGLHVEQFNVARFLINTGRKLGTLKTVRPRETLLMMRKE